MLKTLSTIGLGLLTSGIYFVYVQPWLEAKRNAAYYAEPYTDQSAALENLLNTEQQWSV